MAEQSASVATLDAVRERRAIVGLCARTLQVVRGFVELLRSTPRIAVAEPAGTSPTDPNYLVPTAWLQTLQTINVAHEHLSTSWVQLRAVGLADERRAAIAGGRRGMANGTASAIPITSALCLGTCSAAYGMVLVTTIRGIIRRKQREMSGPAILREADTIIDVDLCGLRREHLQTLGLVAPSRESAQQPNLRTCDGIKSAVNHLRSVWKRLHPTDAPVEEFLFVVQTAIGRAAVAPTADVLATGGGVVGEMSAYRQEFASTKEVRVGVAFFCDMWLHLASMLGRRSAVLVDLVQVTGEGGDIRRLPPPPPASMAAAVVSDMATDWTAEEAEKAHYLASGTASVLREAHQKAAAPPNPDGPYIPEKLALVEWAVVAGQIAASDDLLRQVIQVADRGQLWPGDRELHSAYAAGDDDRPAAILAWKTAGGGSNEETANVTDPIVVLRMEDMDRSIIATACLLRIITQEYQNVGVTELAIDSLCVHWADKLEASAERSGGTAALFTVPSLVEIHNYWVVTFEGVRTEPLLFSAALRVWFFVCVRMEELGRLAFSISMLLQRMQLMRR